MKISSKMRLTKLAELAFVQHIQFQFWQRNYIDGTMRNSARTPTPPTKRYLTQTSKNQL